MEDKEKDDVVELLVKLATAKCDELFLVINTEELDDISFDIFSSEIYDKDDIVGSYSLCNYTNREEGFIVITVNIYLYNNCADESVLDQTLVLKQKKLFI